jgi:hypothetical protein
MMKKSTFEKVCWDFESVWCIDEGKDYPKLRAFGKCNPNDVLVEPNRIEEILQISPNPASDFIELKSDFINYNSIIRIFNIYGTKLIEMPYSNKIDIRSLLSGIYFLEVNNKCVKFIKM